MTQNDLDHNAPNQNLARLGIEILVFAAVIIICLSVSFCARTRAEQAANEDTATPAEQTPDNTSATLKETQPAKEHKDAGVIKQTLIQSNWRTKSADSVSVLTFSSAELTELSGPATEGTGPVEEVTYTYKIIDVAEDSNETLLAVELTDKDTQAQKTITVTSRPPTEEEKAAGATMALESDGFAFAKTYLSRLAVGW